MQHLITPGTSGHFHLQRFTPIKNIPTLQEEKRRIKTLTMAGQFFTLENKRMQ